MALIRIVEPMRVCDLIEELKRFPPLMPVYSDGYGAVVGAERPLIKAQGLAFAVELKTEQGKSA